MKLTECPDIEVSNPGADIIRVIRTSNDDVWGIHGILPNVITSVSWLLV